MSLADIFGRIVSISISIFVCRFVFAHLQVIGPKTVVLFRNSQYGFGFTLRHFIVFPPESPAVSDVLRMLQLFSSLLAINLILLSFANRWAHIQEQNIAGILNLTQPMDTVFVKDVRINGPAYMSGLKPGDRLLNVNGMEVAGAPYATVVQAIQQTPTTLRMVVVPKDCDILQTVRPYCVHCIDLFINFHKCFILCGGKLCAHIFCIPHDFILRSIDH